MQLLLSVFVCVLEQRTRRISSTQLESFGRLTWRKQSRETKRLQHYLYQHYITSKQKTHQHSQPHHNYSCNFLSSLPFLHGSDTEAAFLWKFVIDLKTMVPRSNTHCAETKLAFSFAADLFYCLILNVQVEIQTDSHCEHTFTLLQWGQLL